LSWILKEDTHLGLTQKQFAKYALLQLGVETDISRFARTDVPRMLAPKEEGVAHMTELALTAYLIRLLLTHPFLQKLCFFQW